MVWIPPDSINPWALPSCPLEGVSNLPSCAGIYFAIGSSEVYYIGKTVVGFRERWDAHHKLKDLIALPDVQIAWLASDLHNDSLMILESELIKIHRPKLNRVSTAKPSPRRATHNPEWTVLVKAASDRLKGAGVPIRVTLHGNTIYLRSSRFPPRPGKTTAGRVEISRGPASNLTIRNAERDAHLMWSAIVERRFQWEDYPAYQKVWRTFGEPATAPKMKA